MNKLTGFICLAILTLGCGSAESDIHFPFESWGWEDSVQRVIPDDFLSLSSIEVGTSTLEDVRERFGPAVEFRRGNESYSPSLICYLADTDDTAVIFQSGPLGGWSVVTAIWIGHSHHIDVANCTASSKVGREKASIHGVFPGSSFSTIELNLGMPTYRKLPYIAYRFQDQDVSSSDGPFDITSGLELELKNDRVAWFRVYRQASN